MVWLLVVFVREREIAVVYGEARRERQVTVNSTDHHSLLRQCSPPIDSGVVTLGLVIPGVPGDADLWRTGIWLHSVQVHKRVSLQSNHKLTVETMTMQ